MEEKSLSPSSPPGEGDRGYGPGHAQFSPKSAGRFQRCAFSKDPPREIGLIGAFSYD